MSIFKQLTYSMKETKTIVYPEIGEVKFRRSLRAKRLSIRIRAPKNVCVVLPIGINLSAAGKFVEAKHSWIVNHLCQIEKRTPKIPDFDENQPIKTRFHTLKFCAVRIANGKIEIKILPGIIQINYPEDITVRHQSVQKAIRIGMLDAYGLEAREFLPKRTLELSQQFGFRYAGLRIKNQKTRWGSCSSRNHINLNLQLMRLPDHLIDYVILHELTHTKVKNHSATFWSELARVFPQYQIARKEMKRYAIGF